jgi:hypothetical protein
MKKILLTSIISLFVISLVAQDCSDLFFSEYVEGSANNKTLEIYNPTSDPVDLGLYSIKRYSNGSPFPTEELQLSGTIQPKDVVVVTNGQTDSVWVANGGYWSLPIWEELYNLGDLHCSGEYPTPFYFNGDDALTLETATGGVIDIFGKIGEQPENGWNDIPPTYTAGSQWWTSWTEDQTLVRKYEVKKGVSENPALFMVHMEWDSIPKNTFDSLGFHRCDCGSTGLFEKASNSHSFVLYPNPVVGNTLKINASESWSHIELQQVNGQLIRRINFESATTETTLDVSDLIDGVFLVRIVFTDNTTAVQKVIKR